MSNGYGYNLKIVSNLPRVACCFKTKVLGNRWPKGGIPDILTLLSISDNMQKFHGFSGIPNSLLELDQDCKFILIALAVTLGLGLVRFASLKLMEQKGEMPMEEKSASRWTNVRTFAACTCETAWALLANFVVGTSMSPKDRRLRARVDHRIPMVYPPFRRLISRRMFRTNFASFRRRIKLTLTS